MDTLGMAAVPNPPPTSLSLSMLVVPTLGGTPKDGFSTTHYEDHGKEFFIILILK